MPTLIKHRRIVADDPWRRVQPEEAIPPTGDIIVGWDHWILEQARLREHDGRIGVEVDGDVPIQELGPQAGHFHLIALQFPKSVDGRAYSQARVLREQYDFEGEIRATGEVVRDQLAFMERVGIDAYELPVGRESALAALASFGEFSVHYQNGALQALPRIRRRPGAPGPA